MSDEKLKLQHALERYANANFEAGLAQRAQEEAVVRVAKAAAACSQAAEDLADVALFGYAAGATRRILQGGERVIEISRVGDKAKIVTVNVERV